MDPSFALELINVFPGSGAPTVRGGYFRLAKPATSTIKFMAELPKPDGSSVMVVGTDTALYSITTAGVVSTITKASPHTNGEFNYTIFNNKIYLCNNAGTATDQAQYWDGSAAQALNLSFTGVSLQNLINVSTYRERLYFVEKNSLNFWYGALKAIGTTATALTSYDTSYTFKHGGYLLHAGTYTNQTAATSQNLFFACTSEGELAFWQGTDPANTTGADPWTLVARYKIGKPLGFRSFIRVNQDIWIVTQQGVVPVSSLFQADPEAAVRVVSDKINPLIASSAKNVPFSYLWSGFTWSAGRRVYISAPISASTSWLLVYSMDSKGWTIFQLYSTTDGLSSCLFNNLPHYGSSNGTIWKGEIGHADRAETSVAGNAINFSYRSAFSFYNARGNYKVFRDIRPILQTQKGLSFSLGLDLDFKRNAIIPVVSTSSGDTTAWGSAWGSPWAAATEYLYDRYAVKGQGNCAAIRFGGSIRDVSCQILSFEVRFEIGGQV
jgi:hypothetical protein